MAPRFLLNLIPKKEAKEGQVPVLTALKGLTWIQWAMVFSGWLSWTCDAMDFFNTNAVTLTLLFRSTGAVIFGILSDRYGRKWPLVVNLLICCALQVGSSFCNTYRQFLGVRSLFGVAMGGIWGLSIATALENVPVETRGLLSGVLQQGYAAGYLLSAIVSLTIVPHSKHSWRVQFWTVACLSFSAACLRAALPESALFLRAKEAKKDQREVSESKTKIFFRETGAMLRAHWMLCIYAVLLMTGFNFLSHGSQDLYPTYIQNDKLLSSKLATKATIIGALAGFISQYAGRRLTMISFSIPLWILPSTFSGLAAGAFFIQVGVQGAWGVIPIFLNELSPPAFRATFPGVAYQLGNMISASSARIEAAGGDHLRTIVNGKDVPDYAKVQGILIGVVAAFVVLVVLFGPENHGSHFESHRVAFEEGAGQGNAVDDEGTKRKTSRSNSVLQVEGKKTSGKMCIDKSCVLITANI
ncbi:MFS general substrate transporter [Hysterangium stoloniferum]|nr:MFS general substrate transporter [Hysterangium stoloniferum]